MNCPNCGASMRAFSVPTDMRDHLPDGREHAATCPRCLHLEPADEGPAAEPDWSELSDALPDDDHAATAMVLAVGLLASLALNRSRIVALLEHVERAGVDPFLVLDRLAADPNLSPEVDIDRRRSQLLQMMD